MHSEIYWIEADTAIRLAIMARPRAGEWLEDEIANWKREGISTVLSLLEQHEIDELGLQAEASLCSEQGIQYMSFPIPDRGIPSQMEEALSLAAHLACRDTPVAIHCRAGIGRSSIMAAAIMVSEGIAAANAMAAVSKARRLQTPDTDAQRDWVFEFESRLRDGSDSN